MAHWDGNVYGVSVDPVLSGCVVYMGVESSTRLGGFRALKKTPEASYTTKVNYRKPTSRGTTRCGHTVRLYSSRHIQGVEV